MAATVAKLLFVCTAHSEDIIDAYLSELGRVFELISQCENGKDIDELLDGPVCHGGFKRLT